MISPACYVSCDRCKAVAGVSVFDVDDARAAAAREGFIRTHTGYDLCPDCASQVGSAVTTPATHPRTPTPPGCSALSDVDEVADLTCTHCGAAVQLTGRNRNGDGCVGQPHTCETAAGVGEKGGSDRTREAPGVGQSAAQLHHETVEPGRVNDRAPDPRTANPEGSQYP